MMQQRESMFDSLNYFSAETQYVLPRVLAWINNTFVLDIYLLTLFCAGFCIFRATFVRDTIAALIWSAGTVEKRISDAKGMSDVCASNFDKDASAACDFGPRRRSRAIRAQTAGQPPELPEACTTVVLKNIPTSYTPDALLAALHECGYFGAIDFIYVPIDFKLKDRGIGFAIVNFISTSSCLKFAAEFHLTSASHHFTDAKKGKILAVSATLIQGSKANIRHLLQSPVPAFLAAHPAWLPRVVDRGGLAMPLKAMRSAPRPRRCATIDTSATQRQCPSSPSDVQKCPTEGDSTRVRRRRQAG